MLEGGLNDIPGPLSHFWGAVVETVKTLKSKSNGAPVVLVGPDTYEDVVPEGLTAIDQEEAQVAAQLGIHYISPLQGRWFNPSNMKTLIDQPTLHPNTAGHAYYGGRLASALEDLTTTGRAGG